MTRLSTPPEDRGIRATGESSDVMEAMLQEFALTTNAAERLDATVLIQSMSMKKMYDVLKRTMPLVTAFQKNNTAALANYHGKITEELVSGWEQEVKAAVGISKGAASIRDGIIQICHESPVKRRVFQHEPPPTYHVTPNMKALVTSKARTIKAWIQNMEGGQDSLGFSE
ncbi:MAG: hypothetical protein LQ352_001711 [Teloschistes flavicans]|nr:MAG: hypothetical protein LQ352_001711 [Teloschistes flavicans]